MPKTITNLANLNINYLSEELYEAAKTSGEINENEIYMTPVKEESTNIPQATETMLGGVKSASTYGYEHRKVRIDDAGNLYCTDINLSNSSVIECGYPGAGVYELSFTNDKYLQFNNINEYLVIFINCSRTEYTKYFSIICNDYEIASFELSQYTETNFAVIIRNIDNKIFINTSMENNIVMPDISYLYDKSQSNFCLNTLDVCPHWNILFANGLSNITISNTEGLEDLAKVSIHIG